MVGGVAGAPAPSGNEDKSHKFPFYLNIKSCLAIKDVVRASKLIVFLGKEQDEKINLFDFIASLRMAISPKHEI